MMVCKRFYIRGSNLNEKIQLNSPEFNRVLKNLQFENLSLTPTLQKKCLKSLILVSKFRQLLLRKL